MKKLICVLLAVVLLLALAPTSMLVAQPSDCWSSGQVVLHYLEGGISSGVELPPPHIEGATWHYFTHDYVDPDMQEYCQLAFGTGVVPTRINFCVRAGDGSYHWRHIIFNSCDRPCTTCPDWRDYYGCSFATCSSGWYGNVLPCMANHESGKPPLPPVLLPPDVIE